MNLAAAAPSLENVRTLSLSDMLAVVLVAIVAIAPVPLGSNRPALWALWAAAIGLIALAYGIGLLLRRGAVGTSLAAYWPEIAGLLLLLAWLGVQLLPLGHWLPELTQVPTLGLDAPGISLDPGSTRLTLMSFATYGLLFALVTRAATNPRRAHAMLLAIFLVIAAFAAYSLVSLTQLGDTLLGFDKLYYRGSATGTFVNRNSFATFLAAGLAMGVPLLADSFRNARGTQSALLLVALAVIGAALLMTGSRMGLIAGTVGAGVALLLALPGRRGLAFITGLVAMLTLAVLFGADTLERFLFVSDAGGRAELYRQVWDAILNRPWTGYGGGSFAAGFPIFQHPPLSNDGVWDKAHSTYLALWFELGLAFGSIPVLIVLSLLFRAIRGLWNSSLRSVGVVAIAVVVVFALHSLVDFSAEIMADAFLLTALLGLGAASGAPAGAR